MEPKYESRCGVSTLTQESQKKNYFLTMGSESEPSNRDWLVLSGGLRPDSISIEDLRRSLRKAQAIGAEHIIVPENALVNPLFKILLQMTQAASVRVSLQVMSHRFEQEHLFFLDLQRQYGIGFDIILSEFFPFLVDKALKFSEGSIRWVIPGIKGCAVWDQLHQLPQAWGPHVFWYFPYSGSADKTYSPQDVYKLLRKIKQQQPTFSLQTLRGLDIYESRLWPREDLEPLVEPVIQSKKRGHQICVSVIIPTYNNSATIIPVLQHLQRQTDSSFEIIVVDDGSTDQTSELLLEFFKSEEMSFTVLYYPRWSERVMGDSQFRAGRARNLGARWARGEILSFLDADILVPPDYIHRTKDGHQKHDVLQWRREYLRAQTLKTSHYEAIEPQNDCYIPEGGYWHQFYDRGAELGWSRLENFWKYTCTYALSLPRSLFFELGAFRRTYCFYGCEDTELGWHLSQRGARFQLINKPVYHIEPHIKRSEYSGSVVQRQRLLRVSAEIMFYNTLSEDVYHVFRYLLAPQTVRERILNRILNFLRPTCKKGTL